MRFQLSHKGHFIEIGYARGPEDPYIAYKPLLIGNYYIGLDHKLLLETKRELDLFWHSPPETTSRLLLYRQGVRRAIYALSGTCYTYLYAVIMRYQEKGGIVFLIPQCKMPKIK